MTKTTNAILAAATATAAALLAAQTASAVIYNDTFSTDPALNDLGTTFDGFPHLDIQQVEVTNTASDLTIAITLVGDIQATNWGKYVVGIDHTPGVGDTDLGGNGNPWGRQISISSGMDSWIGSWVDSGGGLQAWRYTDGTASWAITSTSVPTIAPNVVTLTTSLSSLGLSDGMTIAFDVYSTGGGPDGAVDAAGNPAQTIADWPEHYDSVPNTLSYTVSGAVPPPTWSIATGGDWNTASNWGPGGVPNAVGVEAILGNALTTSGTLATSGNVTLGTLNVDNAAASYTIGGTGSLTMQGASSAVLNVASGTHSVAVPLIIANNTRLEVSGGATLTVNDLSMAAGQRITKFGGGTLNVNGAMTNGANSSIAIDLGTINFAQDLGSGLVNNFERPDLYVSTQSGGPGSAANFASTQKLNAFGVNPDGVVTLAAGGDKMLVARSIFVDGNGKLNMNDNDMIIDWQPTSGPSPEFYLRDKVLQARDVGDAGIFFTGSDNIDSDKVLAFGEASELVITEFNGEAIDDTTVVGKYTYYGDANFDGQVTTDDYVAVDLGLGTGDSWVQGDFNLDGSVTTDDYVVVDLNLGKGTDNPLAWADEQAERIALHTEMFGQSYVDKLNYAMEHGWVAASVPEPGALSLAGLGALGLIGRRRRR